MNVFLWVLQGLLAAAFLLAGTGKLLSPYEAAKKRMPWVEDVSPTQLKLIGAVEATGALGLLLPGITGIAEILTPIAATGLAVVMLGAAALHGRRKETKEIGVNVILLLIAAVIAWGRFGSYPL